MHSVAVIVADVARARIFTFEPFQPGPPHLVERAELVDPSRRRPPDPRGKRGPPAHGDASAVGVADDVTLAHDLQRSFSRTIAKEGGRIVKDTGARRLVVLGSDEMLALLRSELPSSLPARMDVTHVALDLAYESPPRLLQQLLRLRLLPIPHAT